MERWQLTETYASRSGMVRWDRFGDPDGEPLVLLHGTPFSSFIWRDLSRALARGHRIHVWDMPGYGASEKTGDQDISLEALTGVFAELLDHWGVTEPLVVAHDSGGAVALGAHLMRGVPYRRLALVDAVALSPWGSAFSGLVGRHAEVFGRLPHSAHRALIRDYVGSASSPGLRPGTLDALVEPWLTPEGQAAFYRQLTCRLDDKRYTDAMEGSYSTVDLPVLVCWGEDDAWVPVERGRELASRIPAARLSVIPGAGHLLPEDKPAELATELFAFLHEPG
ncbi:alpha/beta hydrolase [Streptomyces nanshensis]|nr:alpha/beta hydrolase [Streptomyces nanshensis]